MNIVEFDNQKLARINVVLAGMESMGKLTDLCIAEMPLVRNIFDPTEVNQDFLSLIGQIKNKANAVSKTDLIKILPNLGKPEARRIFDYMVGQGIVSEPDCMQKVKFK